MMNSRLLAICLFAVGTSCLLLGCAGSGRPETYPVRGKVTYRGRPVAGAAVAFLAQGVSRPASGETNDSGEFRLTTFEPNDGAVAGAHTVTVTKFSEQPAPPPPPVEQSPDQEVDPAVIEKAMREHVQRVEKARSELPLKYANFNTSDLRFEVVRGENDFNIQLVD